MASVDSSNMLGNNRTVEYGAATFYANMKWHDTKDKVILCAQRNYVRFDIFTAVTMKNAVFWDVTPCGSC
jgi:hypothetical protein